MSVNFDVEKAMSLEWNGKVFVLSLRNELTGNTYNYAYSYDGNVWTKSTVGNANVNGFPHNIKWSGSQYLMNGKSNEGGNVLLKSRDGVNYSILPINSYTIYDIETNLEQSNTITFPQNTTLALGEGTSKISYSIDNGVTWSPSDSSGTFTNSANNAVWNGKIWVAVGLGGNSIATSPDGKIWTGRGSYIFTEAKGVTWSPELNLFVAAGQGSKTLAYSSDGVYWFPSENSVFNIGLDVQWNGKIWVASGTTTIGKSLAYSYDGKTWQYPSQTDLFSVQGTKITWNGEFWTAVGSDAGGLNMASSVDGINWNMSTNTQITNPINIYADTKTNVTIVLNSTNKVSTTSNNNYSSLNTVDTSLNICNSVLYNGVNYLIGGNTVIVTPDYNKWSSTPIVVNGVSNIRNFAWNHPDQGAASILPMTIALGEGGNTICYSNDGLYWYGTGKSVFQTRANRAVWNGKLWCAVGSGGYWVATSYDGITWTGRDNYWMTEAYDIAWNGSVFVATGYGNVTIATSPDGILWNGVINSPQIFTIRASGIAWTGHIWIAYGSGTNTTAYSNSVNGEIWSATPKKNLVVTDANSVFLESGYLTSNTSYGFDASASSFSGSNEPYKAFDNSFNTTVTNWSSNTTYTSVTGVYSGSVSTTYNTSLTVTGEWIQLKLPSAKIVKYYDLILSVNDTSVPKSWILLASNDGSIWSLLDTFNFGNNSLPNNSNPYPFSIMIQNIQSNTTAYQYYRIVVPSTFGGTSASIQEIDLYMENPTSDIISPHLRPIVTKNSILYQTNIQNITNVGKTTVYVASDLYGNIINDYYVNGGYYANSVITGVDETPITGTAFDGKNYIVCTLGGKVSIMSNNASNTNLNFASTYNSNNLNSNITNIHSACFNGKMMLLGGNGENVITYNVFGEGTSAEFVSSINANELFTTVYDVASNSGYGATYIPNAIYLKPEDKLSVIGPKSYSETITSKTNISINMMNLVE